MGVVYKALQRGMDRLVAIKVLPPELAANGVLLRRFYQEARAAARLDHPNAVRAIAAGQQDGLHYFAMEYVDGESLSRRLKRAGRLEEAEVVQIAVALAKALQAAHDLGMVHRDVKPENVILTSSGEVKLADLGLVKRRDQDLGLTQVGKGLGTTNYMAPEQFRDAKHADARCDIYGLGMTLYSALTGVRPWLGLELRQMYQRKAKGEIADVRQLNPTVSRRTAQAIRRATEPKPAERYSSCSEFLDDLTAQAPARRVEREAETETRYEFHVPGTPTARAAVSESAGIWYVRYTDSSGKRRKLRLETDEVCRGIESGRLAKDVRISPSQRGPWLHLSAFSEFTPVIASLARDAGRVAVESDMERTVAALRAGAPLRKRESPWKRVLWITAGISLLAGTALLFYVAF